MTWLRLAFANLALSPLTTAVNVLLMGLGTASIVLLLLASAQLSDTMSRDARGIDLVVGATGSPVQLILSAVYHADVPPGNIRLEDAQKWAEDPRVKTSIPVSLGDSVRGFRIVGTTPEFLSIYHAQFASGGAWTKPMQAVVGSAVAAATGFAPGSKFAGAHGLVDGGHVHDGESYVVVGVLAPTGTVQDRLVMTSLESVWTLHGENVEHTHEAHDHETGEAPGADEHRHDVGHHDHDAHEESEAQSHEEDTHAHEGHEIAEARVDSEAEITAMLLSYRTPLAATSLPRDINATGSLQAASPAMEVSRVLQLVGVGMTALTAFAWVLVATAGLSIFAALYGSLRARRGEHAMLRCLGATRGELLLYLITEGLLMSLLGVALGVLLGHGVMELVGSWLSNSRGVVMTGWTWAPSEALLLLGLLCVGGLSAFIPAIQAYRTDVARTLAEA